jgi:diazepam-binding inhibitor (GABA receptor modulating acyl-CoA-binding protein)
LELYALYKQATTGDVNTAQPWKVQLEARAKHDAWSSKKGISLVLHQ